MTNQIITTTATGRTSAPPDQVDLQFAARVVDPDITTARPSTITRNDRRCRVLPRTAGRKQCATQSNTVVVSVMGHSVSRRTIITARIRSK